MAGPSLIATLGANISGFVRDLDTAKGHAQTSGEGIGSAFGGALNSALTSIVGAVSIGAIKAAVGEAADYAGKIEDIHQRTDASREALQAWDLVLSQNGSNVQAAVGFFEKLAVSRDKALAGDEKAIKQFQDFGISLEQLQNKKIRSEDLGMDIGKAFEKGDPQKLIGSLKAIGGKSAGELIPAFRDGFANAIDDAMNKGISDQSVKELDKAGDAKTRFKAGFRAEVGEAAGTFLTRMRDFGDLFTGQLGFKDFLFNRGARMREIRDSDERKEHEAELQSMYDAERAKLGLAPTPLASALSSSSASVLANANPSAELTDVQKRSEAHLRRLDKNIETIARRRGQRSEEDDDVQF